MSEILERILKKQDWLALKFRPGVKCRFQIVFFRPHLPLCKM
jgi:hypothetical protein